ncbi:MAG: Wzt carbohydrate-binding domain-containing protein, partial [Elusimicrobiota bacterium]
ETTVILTVKFNKQIVNPIIGIIFKNDKGTLIYGMNTRWRHMTLGTFEADEMVKIIFKQKMQLTGGLYQIDPAIAYSDCITFCDWQENALEFIVDLPIQADGFANLDSQISIIKL